ncbi:hypothetical protein WJX82_008873 [Trebouxia sp. C0006]
MAERSAGGNTGPQLTQGPELSVLALPPELLRRVVDVISNITHLWTRAQVSLISKVFAAAVKEQHKLVISGAFLINQDEQFMLASLKQAPTAFVHRRTSQPDGTSQLNHIVV